MVVSLSIVFINKVNVVRANKLNIKLFREFDKHLIHFFLQRIYLKIGSLGRISLMALEFEIVVLAKHTLKPFNGISGVIDASRSD